MKTFRIVMLMLLFSPIASCQSQPSVKQEATSSGTGQIDAYYFHFTARCITCRTVESSTKENLESLYPEQTKQGKITFQSVNLDEATGKSLAKKLGVTGQTLLLVKGDQKINITNDGFMYAIPKPEKFKSIISEKMEYLLSSK